MKIIESAIIVLFVTIFTFSLSAQIISNPSNIIAVPNQAKINNPEEKSKIEAKEKLLAQRRIVLNQILSEIEKLETPEERATYLSAAGNAYCKDGDKPRAIELFERSINEFYAAKAKAEMLNEIKSFEIVHGGSSRIQIIQNVNPCDSELAYEYLLKTRPQRLSEILNSFYQNPFYSTLDPKVRGIVSWEISREINLKSEILRIKPERAEEFINRDLNTFISSQTLRSIETLSRSKPSLANNLAESVVEKLLRTQFYNPLDKNPIAITYPNNFQVAASLLESFGGNSKNTWSKLKISDDNLVKLADKLAKDAIDSKFEWIYADALNLIKSLVPDRYAQFEQMKAEKSKTPEAIEAKKYTELTKTNPSSEILLSNAKDFSEKYQTRIFRLTACKLVGEERFDEAEKLLIENFSDKENVNKRLGLIVYTKALAFGNNKDKKDFVQAEKLIYQIPDAQLKIDALATLSEIIYRLDPINNKSKALMLLSDALTEFDASSKVINQQEAFNDIISVYSLVDPDAAFSMFDYSINTKAKINTNGETLKKYGEIKDIKAAGLFGFIIGYDYNKTVSNLQKRDFYKTLDIINKLSEPRTRIAFKLHLLETKSFFYDFSRDQIIRYCNP